MLGWLAIACVAIPIPFVWARPPYLIAALCVAACASLGLALAHRVRARPRGWVFVHPWGLERVASSRGSAHGGHVRRNGFRFSEPFGVTTLASQARRRAILAITTPTQTRFIGVRLEGPAVAALLAHASIVADGDALAAHASDDDSMSAEAALALLRLIHSRVPVARNRLYLSGTRGERIVLDGAELRVELGGQTRRFDLALPVEWRGFLFHEGALMEGGPAASVYQATWLRQGAAELVFVAPMPTEPLLFARGEDEPPAGDLRTGIERVFMLPVREALARAPKPARSATPKRVSSPDLGI